MYKDPEKAHRERQLIAEIDRLHAIILEEKSDLALKAKVIDTKDECYNELENLWAEMRKEHINDYEKKRNVLLGILWALMIIMGILIREFR